MTSEKRRLSNERYRERHKDDPVYKERRRLARHRFYAKHKDDPAFREMKSRANRQAYLKRHGVVRLRIARPRKPRVHSDDFFDTHPSVLYPNYGE